MRLSKRFKIIKRIKNNIIYWGALFLVKVVSFIPVDTAVKIGKIGGRLAFYILKTERKRTLKNLYLAFGNEKNDKEIKIIARKVFENLGKNLFEVLSLGKGNKKILEMVELKEKNVVEKILKKKKGGFFITGHIGNWELMAAYLAMQGYKVNVMARSIYDERLNKLIVDFRSSYGINTLLRQTKRSAKEIIRILSNNEFLGVLIDQDVKKVEKVKVKFFGREIRGIRRHYGWLRKRLQERGLLKVVKRIGGKERRCINAVLHRVSKEIVSLADSTNSFIVLGDLTGIRQRTKNKGKRLRRIVGNMPYYKLTKMIEYKAMLKGIPVITISEAYTSRICHKCGSQGKRKTQGLFVCNNCGEYNADLNGAINIAKKFERNLGYMPLFGAVCEPALNKSVENSPLETPSFRLG